MRTPAPIDPHGPDAPSPRAEVVPDGHQRILTAFLGACIVGAGRGAVLWAVDAASAAHVTWQATTALGMLAATAWIVRGLREHRVGIDVIALLALAGTLAVGEPFAGAVVALMKHSASAELHGVGEPEAGGASTRTVSPPSTPAERATG